MDFDRTLAARGHDDALRMGRAIAKLGVVPDAIVSSPAARAKQTAEGAARGMKLARAVRFESSLYDAPGEVWLEVLRRLPAPVATVLVVAHSPGVEEAAALLCGAAPAAFDVPTGAVIALNDAAPRWRDLEEGTASVRWFLRPKLVGLL